MAFVIYIWEPQMEPKETMKTIFFFKIILMFVFFFGLLGFITSPFMKLEKMEKVGGWSLMVTILSLIGILFLNSL